MTKKTLSNINNKLYKEKDELAKQIESYSSTVSHEMRTPIASVMFFIKYIIDFVMELPEKSVKRDRSLRYLLLIDSQLQLMQNFVSDLLDLKQLKDGVFNLIQEKFDPNEIMNLVCSIFSPQSETKGVVVSW